MDQILPSGKTITLVHYLCEMTLPPTDRDGPPCPQGRIACMPGMTEFHATPYHPNYQRTDDWRAVSCPACKQSSQFKQATKATGQTASGTPPGGGNG